MEPTTSLRDQIEAAIETTEPEQAAAPAPAPATSDPAPAIAEAAAAPEAPAEGPGSEAQDLNALAEGETEPESQEQHQPERDEVVASINLAVDTDRVVLTYRQRQHGGQWQDMSYPVWLERTPCHFGGVRVWWRCPAAGCGRRVAILHGGAVFACRRCHQLAYRCQRETDYDRVARRADTIRRRIGWEPGILNGGGLKPKGMHWRTFERIQAAHDRYVNLALAGAMEKFGLSVDDIGFG